MTTDLAELVAKVKTLSPEELLTIQETVTAELRRNIASNPGSIERSSPKRPDTEQEREAILNRFFLPQVRPEELEGWIAKIVSPEELVRIRQVDLTKLPPLPPGAKSLSQLLIDDREDRL